MKRTLIYAGLKSEIRAFTFSVRLALTRRAGASEAGDVPGWVMVTLMTAGLVMLIWAVAGPALTNLFNQAIAAVTGVV